MRLLVISDIHANLPALLAVAGHQQFDRAICLGDIVDYGPHPKECLDWVRGRCDLLIRGNHDQAAAKHVGCQCSEAFRHLSEATRAMTWRLLTPDDLSYLAVRPIEADFMYDGTRYHAVHAAPSDPLYRYLGPDDREQWQAEIERVGADMLLVGHTHVPMILYFGGKVVVNPGSVGQPRDGDARAEFAVIENGLPHLCRIPYDIEETVRDLSQAGLEDSVASVLGNILRTGGKEW